MFEGMQDAILGNLWLQLSLLLSFAIASSFLFAKFRQPKILGHLVIGIVIGPSVLGLISVGGTQTGDMVEQLANLGAILLLFMIGLECDIRELYTRRSMVIALGGVVVPWICGFVLAWLMLPQPGVGYDKFAQSVFVGAALVATSVAITASVLREMKVIGSDTARIILGAAVVDDVLGMVVLGIAKGTAEGTGIHLDEMLWLLFASATFVGLGAYLGSKYISRAVAAIQKRGAERGIEESGFLLALCIAFIYSVVSESIGISAIIGAFVAGTSFARCEFSSSYKKQLSVLEMVFAPIFFVSLGILVDLREMSGSAWLFAALLTVVALSSKVAGCGIPARLLGLSRRESIAIGIGMSPRMEVAMIIGLYGLTVGIISMEIYSVIILMGLLTAVFAPLLLRNAMSQVPKSEEVCPVEPVSGRRQDASAER
jgi:Kef-type K+ transport system membrane component KefB